MEGQITLANHYDKDGGRTYCLINQIRESNKNFWSMCEALSRKHAMEYARLTSDFEEVTKDQKLHRKTEEMLSMMKDLADKTYVCTSDPRSR